MLKCNILKCQPVERTGKNSGFTLIEVLVAMAIIALMIFAITPLIVFNVSSIYDSGNKSKTLITNRGVVEKGIAENSASENAAFPVKYISPSVGSIKAIKGGVVKSGKIKVFLADAPSISINPSAYNEGSFTETNLTYKIIITGYNTHFDTTTKVELFNSKGALQSTWNSVFANGATTGIIYAPASLTNAGSIYDLKISTRWYKKDPVTGATLPEYTDEVVRSDLVINRPIIIAVGESGKNTISNDSEKWKSKTSGISDNISSIAWGNKKFVCTGDNGRIFVLDEGKDWTLKETGTQNRLNKVVWYDDRFIAVGNQGTVLYSQDGETWTRCNTPEEMNNLNLYSAAMLNDTICVAGSNAAVYASYNRGETWGKAVINSTASVTSDINDMICSSNIIVAAGNNGTVLTSSDGLVWQNNSILNLNGNIKSITTDKSGKFIIAGENGLVATSVNGTNWDIKSVNITKSLNCITSYFNTASSTEYFIAVGNGGEVLVSKDCMNWSTKSTAGSVLRSICHQ